MISPSEIKGRASRRYPAYLSSLVTGESQFPLEISFAKVKSGEAAHRWTQLASELEELRLASDEGKPGKSYHVEWEERRDRLAGNQRIPVSISFPDETSFLAFLGKGKEANLFREDLKLILEAFPPLSTWAAEKPLAIVEHAGEWPGLLAVLRWLVANPRSGFFVREIPAVEDTKFIEGRKAFIRALLDRVTPESMLEKPKDLGFEERCGLRIPKGLVRLRFLDREISGKYVSGLEDISIPSEELGRLDFPEIKRVLVMENKASFGRADVLLTAPLLRGTVAIFGSGYAASLISGTAWLHRRQIGYWGDIDSHGLRILAEFRKSFPEAESILMDEETFDRFPEYRSDAPSDEALEPEELNLDELRLLRRLLGLRVANRLEQERIPLSYAREKLVSWAESGYKEQI